MRSILSLRAAGGFAVASALLLSGCQTTQPKVDSSSA